MNHIKVTLLPSGLALLIWCLSLFLSTNVSAQLTPDRIDASNTIDNVNVQRDPVRLIDNVWWVGHSQVGAFLITTPDGHVLVDTTHPHDVHWVVENIVKAGFKLADIKYIINTHPHGEHIGGLAAMRRLIPEAKSITSEATAYDLATGGIHDYRYVYGTDDEVLVEQFEPVTVDGHIADGGKLTLGNITLTAHLTPGHMKGVTTWSFPVRDKGKEYTAVIMGGMSAPGPDDGPLIGNEIYPETAEDFHKSFEYLKGLKCDVYLYVRAPTIELNEKLARLKGGGNRVNPFVDPEGCQQFVSFYEARFQKRLEEEKAGK